MPLPIMHTVLECVGENCISRKQNKMAVFRFSIILMLQVLLQILIMNNVMVVF